jgi:transcriptional regulator with XRE-family HTH domain
VYVTYESGVKEMGTLANADVAAAVEAICKALQLSSEELAEALGTTRQSVYRWREGGPAEGPARLILLGLSERLRKANRGALEDWVRKVRNALQQRSPPLDTLEALIVPPTDEQRFREFQNTVEIVKKFIQRASGALKDMDSSIKKPARGKRRRALAR